MEALCGSFETLNLSELKTSTSDSDQSDKNTNVDTKITATCTIMDIPSKHSFDQVEDQKVKAIRSNKNNVSMEKCPSYVVTETNKMHQNNSKNVICRLDVVKCTNQA